MSFSELLEQTRTYHNFLPSSVEETFVNKLIENALKAPNHKYTFPWKYIWLKGSAKEKLAQNFLESKRSSLDAELGRDEKFFLNKIMNPEILFLIQEKAQDPFTLKEDYATLSCSVQIMALYLREQKKAYKWSTGGFTRDAKTYDLLNIDTQKEEIIGVLFFGDSEQKLANRRRPQVTDVLKTMS